MAVSLQLEVGRFKPTSNCKEPWLSHTLLPWEGLPMQAVILISARRVLGAEGCDRYRRSYDGYVPLHKLNSNFLYVRGWLVPLGPRGGGFQHMCTPRFSATPLDNVHPFVSDAAPSCLAGGFHGYSEG